MASVVRFTCDAMRRLCQTLLSPLMHILGFASHKVDLNCECCRVTKGFAVVVSGGVRHSRRSVTINVLL